MRAWRISSLRPRKSIVWGTHYESCLWIAMVSKVLQLGTFYRCWSLFVFRASQRYRSHVLKFLRGLSTLFFLKLYFSVQFGWEKTRCLPRSFFRSFAGIFQEHLCFTCPFYSGQRFRNVENRLTSLSKLYCKLRIEIIWWIRRARAG